MIAFLHGDLRIQNSLNEAAAAITEPNESYLSNQQNQTIDLDGMQTLMDDNDEPNEEAASAWRRDDLIEDNRYLISRILVDCLTESVKNENKSNLSLRGLMNKPENSHKRHKRDHLEREEILKQKNQQKKITQTKKRKPCVYGVHDFTSALLYSVETQHTIGYGLRHITEECSFAIVFLMFQSCFGIFVQGLVAGVVFAKISRPNKRKRTIIFSHNAVVSERDGKLCFMFKLANIRITQLSDARVKMLMIKSRRTSEGEFIPFQSYDMKVGHEWSGNDSIFFPWPKTVEHIIDQHSPMYEMCKHAILDRQKQPEEEQDESVEQKKRPRQSKNIKNEDYEIVVILEGNIETTGASCHIRTSYLPQEILFGYRFTPIYPKFTNFEYLFDYSRFDHVEPFQYDLMHLNVAYVNRHLNYVYDALNENKNFHLTYQNTLQTEQKQTGKQAKQPISLSAILSAFKANAITVNNNQQQSGSSSPLGKKKSANSKSNSGSINPSPYNSLNANLNKLGLNTSTTACKVIASNNELCQNESKKFENSSNMNHLDENKAKNGRFTVVKVQPNTENLITINVNETIDMSNRTCYSGLPSSASSSSYSSCDNAITSLDSDMRNLSNKSPYLIHHNNNSNNASDEYKKQRTRKKSNNSNPLSRQVLFQLHCNNANKLNKLNRNDQQENYHHHHHHHHRHHTHSHHEENEEHSHHNHSHHHHHHHRANSLPPIQSESRIAGNEALLDSNQITRRNSELNTNQSQSTEDEGYLTGQRSRNDLNE
jgi:hypothetical protein